MIRCYFFLVMLLGIGSGASAALPPVVFNTVSSTNGLPQNSGRALLQDSEGFVWVGTEDGLVRFDGNAMLSFRKIHDNPSSLSDNYISSLAEDNDGRIWAGTMGGGLNVIDKQRSTVARIQMLESADIRDIAFDSPHSKMWLATGEGLYVFDTNTPWPGQDGKEQSPLDIPLRQVPLRQLNGAIYSGAVSGITLAGEDIWFCTRGDGVGRYTHSTGKTTWFNKGQDGLEDNTFNTVFRDQDGEIWLGSQNQGIVKLSGSGSQIRFSHLHNENSELDSNDIMAISDADEGRLWVGSWNGGLALLDKETLDISLYRYQRDDQYSLPSDIIMNIIRTRSGQVWLGTFDKGVSWFHPDSPFHTYRRTPGEKAGLPSNIIWSFAAEGEDALWIGSNKGLSRLDLVSQKYFTPEVLHPAELWEEVRKDDIRALFMDDDELWVAARKHGVVRISLSAGTITPLSEIASAGQKLTHPYIRLIYKDSNGIIWFGATKGLNRLDPKTGEIRNYLPEDENNPSLPHYRIRALFEDHTGQLWVGTSYGLYSLDSKGNSVKVFKPGDAGTEGLLLAGNGVRGIGEDDKGQLWFATEGGLSVYNPLQKRTTLLREKNGLPSNASYCAVLADGYMWSTTLHGLARINPDTLSVEKYTTDDGLPDNEFNFNAWHLLPNGKLAIGTLSGFTLFSPEKVPGPEQSGFVPPLYLQPYVYQQEGRRIPASHEDEPIQLDWANNQISFEYGALNFGRAGAVLYDFKLHGVNDKWNRTDNQRLITFTGLAAGNYKFVIRARDIHGQWVTQSKPVEFSINQVPWKTTEAYFMYMILLCGFLILGFTLYNRRLHQRSLYLENLVTERTGELRESNLCLQEQHHRLDQLNTSREKLFRAIAHELRTPLTVIMSSLESLQDREGERGVMLQMIYQRASQIGSLLDHLLDLANKTSKVTTNGKPFSVVSALEETVAPFRQQAIQEGKELRDNFEIDDTYLTLKREIFTMMISNLLSNAFKFTTKGDIINISGTCSDEQLMIVVEDSGIGVTESAKQRIFNWFEQENPQSGAKGWGIGLAFTRDEVEAAGGTIELCQNNQQGAKFMITLPLTHNLEVPSNPQANPSLVISQHNEHPALSNLEKEYTLLIIEDDLDLCRHLSTLFPPHWKILTAPDAESGSVFALEEEPDIIITDLMLPGESGFDLTRKLKDHPQTAHIPIIILTALGNEENRLTGLGLSADSFIGKPFNNKELRMRVASLLSNREKILAHARQMVFNRPDLSGKNGENTLNNPENEFLTRLNRELGQDQEVSQLSLEEAARKMAMSKRSLQREMEKIGISWREYKRFRRIRLAMDLLSIPDKSIGDVAESTGYNSTAHFSKTFKEETGKSPSEWRRNL